MAIVGTIAAVVAAGVGAQQSHASQVHSAQNQRDAVTEQNKLMAKADEQQKGTELNQAQAAARARDRALAASTSTNRTDVATTNTGDVGTPNIKKSSLLGM